MFERMTHARMSVICRQSESMSMHVNCRGVSEHYHMLHDLDLHMCNPQGSVGTFGTYSVFHSCFLVCRSLCA